MRIIDNKGLLTQQMRNVIENQAKIKFDLGNFHSLSHIHDKMNVDIVIEDICPNKCHIQLEDALKRKLQQLNMLNKLRYNNEEVMMAEKMRLNEHIVRLRRIKDSIVVLGEYHPDDGNIYLYIETIAAFNDWQKYLKTTYIHEMFHAYFDRDIRKYVLYHYQIEEPLAEAGMLFYLHNTNDVDLNWAVQNVKDKMPLLAEYSYGADLYDMWIHGILPLKSIVENYKFEIDDDLVNSHIDVVRLIHSKPVSKNRDSFERWLVVQKGYTQSSSNKIASVNTTKSNLQAAILFVSKGRTNDIYEITSQELNMLIDCPLSSKSLYEEMVKIYYLYNEFLNDRVWQTLHY